MEPAPDYELDDVIELTTVEQVKALGSLLRHQVIGLLNDHAATASQLAEQLGVLKGSMSYHLKVLEEAGLVRVVRTNKVRGVTERYYGRVSRRFELRGAFDEPSNRGMILRHTATELETAPPSGDAMARIRRLQLTPPAYAEIVELLEALSERAGELQTDGAPDATLLLIFFRPAGAAS